MAEENATATENKKRRRRHIVLTSHPSGRNKTSVPIQWGAKTAQARGPIIGSTTDPDKRNAIGTHSGSYSIYLALAIASGALDPEHRPDLTNTRPTTIIGPHQQWFNPKSIVSLDPFGHQIAEVFSEELKAGYDIRPSIAITKAQMQLPELQFAIKEGTLKPDGKVLLESGDIIITKAAIEPVWYLPGIAERFGVELSELRRILFEHTGGMFPELVTRPDLNVLLPPIGGVTLYLFGDLETIPDPTVPLTVRVHDECNGSDVFGSDICTCRPYLVYGITSCVETAQKGGAGVIAYFRKEGRALGEVTKFLVYNARKRQEGGDTAKNYFERTECVAGVQDVRFQELMPDVLHWLGITRIQEFVSMSNMKYDAVVRSGISIDKRVTIPDDMIPPDAQVEMQAKKAAGYFTDGRIPDSVELRSTRGRHWEDKTDKTNKTNKTE